MTWIGIRSLVKIDLLTSTMNQKMTDLKISNIYSSEFWEKPAKLPNLDYSYETYIFGKLFRQKMKRGIDEFNRWRTLSIIAMMVLYLMIIYRYNTFNFYTLFLVVFYFYLADFLSDFIAQIIGAVTIYEEIDNINRILTNSNLPYMITLDETGTMFLRNLSSTGTEN